VNGGLAQFADATKHCSSQLAGVGGPGMVSKIQIEHAINQFNIASHFNSFNGMPSIYVFSHLPTSALC